jgi:Cu+-exporting ATPase
MVYAGGKQTGEELTLRVLKPVAGSYLTSLWNHYAFKNNKAETNDAHSATHILSKYFTWVLLSLALCTAIYWAVVDPSKIMGSVTAMLIVACPCALLLTVTFTNGNLMRIFSNNGLFLRDATVIEQLAGIDHIVFDKTGTLTHKDTVDFICSVADMSSDTQAELSDSCKDILYNAVCSSNHPYSKALTAWLGERRKMVVNSWEEYPGKGIEATVNGNYVNVGSYDFLGFSHKFMDGETATVYVRINSKILLFNFVPVLREAVPSLISQLNRKYKLSLLSGDNEKQRNTLSKLFTGGNRLLFQQKPIDKLNYIESLQNNNEHVMMIGDGLNDAGALQQSNVGVTLADDINNFTPSCDAILDAKKFRLLPSLLKLSKASRGIIAFSFVISIIYNVVGLFFAMSARMQPMIAAILMPCSTLSIVLITSGLTTIIARFSGMSLKGDN